MKSSLIISAIYIALATSKPISLPPSNSLAPRHLSHDDKISARSASPHEDPDADSESDTEKRRVRRMEEAWDYLNNEPGPNGVTYGDWLRGNEGQQAEEISRDSDSIWDGNSSDEDDTASSSKRRVRRMDDYPGIEDHHAAWEALNQELAHLNPFVPNNPGLQLDDQEEREVIDRDDDPIWDGSDSEDEEEEEEDEKRKVRRSEDGILAARSALPANPDGGKASDPSTWKLAGPGIASQAEDAVRRYNEEARRKGHAEFQQRVETWHKANNRPVEKAYTVVRYSSASDAEGDKNEKRGLMKRTETETPAGGQKKNEEHSDGESDRDLGVGKL